MNSNVRVGLVQINNSFSGQNYLPYSVALLQGYVLENATDCARYNFLPAIYKRQPIRECVEKLIDADVVGFSTYVWNGRMSLEIARRLKQRRPEMLIIFGGPHVPDQPENFLRENPFVDVVIHNEGEARFLELLEAYPSNDWSSLLSASWIDASGRFVKNAAAPRFRELDDVPSPFLNGVFDQLVANNPDERWIGLWETNRGCPFRCTFCDWGSATAAKVTKFGLDRLYEEVHWFARHKVEYIFCCDANFGIQKRDVDIAEYVAKVKSECGYPSALSVQNTKNATERAYLTQKILSDAGLNKGVALSMQSVDMNTLESIKRDNISLETYMELQRRFTKDKVETYSDLILALPGETYESFVQGVNLLMENGQHNRIQFNNLSILPNAEMGDPAYQKMYGMKTVTSKIINIHGERVELEDDVDEVQELVVATASMPEAEWRKTRSFCWMTALLHFNKIMQIPLMVAHEISGIPYSDMIEAFIQVDGDAYSVLGEIRDLFEAEAKSIQQGGSEYVFSKEWLGIYWPADEYVFIKLTADEKFDEFYEEARHLLESVVAAYAPSCDLSVFEDAADLNRALVKQPFVSDDVEVTTAYDLVAFYEAVRANEPARLRKAETTVLVERSKAVYDDFQEWSREVVWWGNKKGAYLYTNKQVEKQIAGHF
jgi:radical SAM superfamily enzyme YgiQ (UPF0313 family)